ncbi:MAG: glycosyltransferase family 4 protein [Halobacteriota archaeon]
MRVCIIGDFSDDLLNEGLKNVAHHLAESISQIPSIEVLKVDNKRRNIKTLKKLKQFRPQVLHYVPGLTNVGIAFLKIIERYLNHPKIFVSATFPYFNDSVYKFFNLKPYCVFAPSGSLKDRMDALATPSMVLPNGVDVEKFVSVSALEKTTLRKKYGLDPDTFTVLHVGHVLKRRALDQLTNLSKENQTILVASGYLQKDVALLDSLRHKGCIVFEGYFSNVEEFYQLCDCYVFPVQQMSGSILCPLSVMEAMACNLPVVTSDVNGIGTFFEEGEGLIFATDKEDFCHAVEDIKAGKVHSATREKVHRYTWQDIAKTIANVYLESLSNGAA